jgi:hypothetical protein
LAYHIVVVMSGIIETAPVTISENVYYNLPALRWVNPDLF